MAETVTYRTLSTTDPMFRGRVCNIVDVRKVGILPGVTHCITMIPVPDNMVLCNGCNQNQHPGTVEAVYFDGQLHDVYCTPCREQYFPQAT